MPTPRRVELITQIEKKRGSRVLVYVLGDRPGQETKIATDVFPFILEHLLSFGRVSHLDLFLYTSGGLINAASGLVALIKEFAEKFSVLIPFKAHSAGTLIALGANSIVMSRVGQLTPVDPTINSPYNPPVPSPVPGAPPQFLPVNVEDVIAYIELGKEEVGLKSESALAAVFQDLASKVHPLALGNVYRARAQIRLVARRLLKANKVSKEKIDRIVSTLTKELYSHDYIIGRKEAIEVLGLPVEELNPDWDEPVWSLYKEYESLLGLTVRPNRDVLLGEQVSVPHTFTRAIIESSAFTHAFQTVREIRRVRVSKAGVEEPIVGVQERTLQEGWVPNAEV